MHFEKLRGSLSGRLGMFLPVVWSWDSEGDFTVSDAGHTPVACRDNLQNRNRKRLGCKHCRDQSSEGHLLD